MCVRVAECLANNNKATCKWVKAIIVGPTVFAKGGADEKWLDKVQDS
jgi:hypothetical protein